MSQLLEASSLKVSYCSVSPALLWHAGDSVAPLEREALRAVAALSQKCRPGPLVAGPSSRASQQGLGLLGCLHGLCQALVHVTGSSPAFIPNISSAAYSAACSIKMKYWFFQFLGWTQLHLFSLSVRVTLKKVS